MPEQHMLTIDEAAKFLNVQAVDVRRLLQTERLSAVKDAGGKWRISAVALGEYIEEVRSLKPTAEPKAE